MQSKKQLCLIIPTDGTDSLTLLSPPSQFWWFNHVRWPPRPKPQDHGCSSAMLVHGDADINETSMMNVYITRTSSVLLLPKFDCWGFVDCILAWSNTTKGGKWYWNTALLLPLHHIFFIISHKKYFRGQHKWNYSLWGFLEMLKY